jgi:hypothetical protein
MILDARVSGRTLNSYSVLAILEQQRIIGGFGYIWVIVGYFVLGRTHLNLMAFGGISSVTLKPIRHESSYG